MILPLALFTVFLLGFWTAKLFLNKFSLPRACGLYTALAFPLGSGMLSLILFFSYLIAGSKGPALAVTLYLLTLSYFFAISFDDIRRQTASLSEKIAVLKTKLTFKSKRSLEETRELILGTAAFLFFCYIFAQYWHYFWGQVTWNPLGGWDARYFWKLKASFYFRSPAEWLGMFSSLPGSWSHPDYPLMLPGTFAWLWILTGKETLIAPILTSLLFSLSLAGLIFWYLWNYSSRIAALIAVSFFLTVPMWRFWSTTLYADIPLTFFMTAAGIFLVLSLRQDERRLIAAAGLFCGLSLWTKDEGLLFSGWILLLIAVTGFLKHIQVRTFLRILTAFISGIAIPLLAVTIIKCFLGTSGAQYLGSGRSSTQLLSLLFATPEKSGFIATVFGVFAVNHTQWNGLWILCALSALAGLKKSLGNYRWVFLALILLLWTGYFLILHITPHDLRFQIESALMRIMSHAMGFGMILMIESLFHNEPAAKINR